jgi:hypothetical protein
MIKLKDLLTEKYTVESTSNTYGADDGEPDTGFIRGNTVRTLGILKGKPELWFNRGDYKQLVFPEADYIYGKGGKEDFSVRKQVYIQDVEAKLDAEDSSWERYVRETVMNERIDYLQIASDLVKAYNLKSKVKFAPGSSFADYVPETDTINLRKSYPSIKEFIITVLHEIKHALDTKRLGVKKFTKKYAQAGTVAAYVGLDPHDDNKWEENAEKWAQQRWPVIRKKMKLK